MSLFDTIKKVRNQLKTLDRYDMVLVKWEDIVSDSSWVSDEGIDDATTAICYSTGFLIRVEETHVKLSSSYDFNAESGSIEVIPIGCIISVIRLEEDKDE